MRKVSLSHIGIVAFLLVFALGVWGARLIFLKASAEVLKPVSISHHNNVIDPATGQTNADAAVDFSTRNDRSTFSMVFLNDEKTGEESSDVLFYNFSGVETDARAFRIGINYAFEKNEGDDGFAIEYSFEGNASCSDAESRVWTELAEVFRENGKVSATAIIPDASVNEICLRISQSVRGDFDAAGYKYHDSNALKVYDIWLDVAQAEIGLSLQTLSKTFAVGEQFEYRINVRNDGAGDAENVLVSFPIPEEVVYERSSQNFGTYNPVTGIWTIETLPAETSMDLWIVARIEDAFLNDRIHATASIDYNDVLQEESFTYGTSATFTVSDVPANIPVTPVGEGLTPLIIDSLTTREEVPDTGDESTESEDSSASTSGVVQYDREIDGVYYNADGIIVGVRDDLLVFDELGNYLGPSDEYTTYNEETGEPIFFLDLDNEPPEEEAEGVNEEEITSEEVAIDSEPITEGTIITIPEEMCFDCDRTTFYLYLVNPDGSLRDTKSQYARVEKLDDRLFNVWFEDKGEDFDYNDIGFELDLRDCHHVKVTMHTLNAGWHHQVKANIYFDGVLQQAVTLWNDSHEGVGETVEYDLESYVDPSYKVCLNS